MIFVELFLAFLNIGLFSFGGGYAAMPLIQNQVIEKYGWMSMQQFTDLVTIAEMTPGPIAINASTFVGNLVAGIPGAIVATLGCVLPSCLIVGILAYIYSKYGNMKILKVVLLSLRPAVIAAIAVSGITIFSSAIFLQGDQSIALENISPTSFFIFIFAVVLLTRKKNMSPILIMFLCGIIAIATKLLLAFS